MAATGSHWQEQIANYGGALAHFGISCVRAATANQDSAACADKNHLNLISLQFSHARRDPESKLQRPVFRARIVTSDPLYALSSPTIRTVRDSR